MEIVPSVIYVFSLTAHLEHKGSSGLSEAVTRRRVGRFSSASASRVRKRTVTLIYHIPV